MKQQLTEWANSGAFVHILIGHNCTTWKMIVPLTSSSNLHVEKLASARDRRDDLHVAFMRAVTLLVLVIHEHVRVTLQSFFPSSTSYSGFILLVAQTLAKLLLVSVAVQGSPNYASSLQEDIFEITSNQAFLLSFLTLSLPFEPLGHFRYLNGNGRHQRTPCSWFQDGRPLI